MVKQYVKGRVSVITPVYNAGKFIEDTIISVLEQTYEDIELVLVDDCSTDNSADIISRYTSNYSNIIYHLQDCNMGAGVARNKALEISTGQYVAFLDSDDLWLPEKITRQMELMQKTGSPFSYTAIEMIDSNNNMLKSKRNIRESCDYKYLLKNTIIATSSVVIDRCQVGDFRMSTRRGGQDYATWLMLLRKDIIARGINEALVKYRVSSDSLSSNKFKSIKQVWNIQVKDEGIKPIKVCVNEIFFICNAIKKHYF